MSVFKGNRNVTKLLLFQNADPFQSGPKGSNVLHVCAERNFHEIARDIININPEINSELVYQQTTIEEDEEETGMTPLHVAIEWNSMELVEYYFEIGGQKLVEI